MSIGNIDSPWDNPDDEKLDIKAHSDALADFICQCQTPMTIAIQGDWGTGKTSMMEIVKKQLEKGDGKKGKYSVIWFNTWQYSQFNMQDDVPVVMLLELLNSLGYNKNDTMKVFGGLFKRILSAGGTFFVSKYPPKCANNVF